MSNVYAIADAYKGCHPFLMPQQDNPFLQSSEKIDYVFTGWTGRYYKYMADCPETVIWGQQARIRQYMIDWWSDNFFGQDIAKLEAEHVRKVSVLFHPMYSGFEKFKQLHELGYLPIEIWGLPEGTLCPAGVPDHWIRNTHPDFAWLPQYLEDLWSTNNWHPSTSATTAHDRRRIMQKWVDLTCDDESITKYLISDFSLRGLTEIFSAAYASTGGHLLSFAKTATIGVADFLEKYYNADIEKDLPKIGTPSLEHSITCQNIAVITKFLENGGEYKGISWAAYKDETDEDGNSVDIKLVAELAFMKYLLTELQPDGALSYVADTNDYWGVLTWIIPKLKEDILNRKGALILRPDSGVPERIICGYSKAATWYEKAGSLEVAAKIFGCTTNKKGYKVLPPQFRFIYADAITRERNESIPKYCAAMGYSCDNVYFGIGSVSYQFTTRDARGYAIKATSCTTNMGDEIFLQKQPKTDTQKASQKGCFAAHYDERGNLTYTDGLTYDEAVCFPGNLYVPKLKDGKQLNIEDFATIRNRLWGGKF